MTRTLLPLAATFALALPSTALACGGFFCSSVPIDQSKERIVFAIDEDKEEVETHVQIFYAGAAEEFAWVVPVPKRPEVGLSSDALFTQLEWRTAPQFMLNWREIGRCEYDMWTFGGIAEGAVNAPSADSDSAGGEVVVVEQQQVGPYDQVTLQATSTESLLEWLNDNGYVIPADVGRALDPYVSGDAYFVALKLSNNRDAGDIAPIKMRYAGTVASIPVVMTALAATPDMRIQPYVFANGKRGVPDNYLHVQINEAAVNWLTGGGNYDDVVTLAANEAGGHAFATDFSGPTSSMQGSLYAPGRFDLERLNGIDDPADYVDNLMGMGLPSSSTLLSLFQTYIPMPASLASQGVTDQNFYNCMRCYEDVLGQIEFDPEALTAQIDELIVTPLREAETLFSRFDTVTRMTSSMSPTEMTLDPYFVLNADMGPVSNQHQADLVIDCGDGGSWSESPRYIELQDGRQILVPPESYFWNNNVSTDEFFSDLGTTNAVVIERTSATGQPVLVSHYGADVDASIADHNAGALDLMPYTPAGFESEDVVAGCGCASTPASGQAGWVAALGLLTLGLRRRK
jgi:MYXO-CTERM domain-containing protein